MYRRRRCPPAPASGCAIALLWIIAGCFNPPPLTTDPNGDSDTPDSEPSDTTGPTSATSPSTPTDTGDPSDSTTSPSGDPATSTTSVDPTLTTSVDPSTTGSVDCMLSTDCADGFCDPEMHLCVDCLTSNDCKTAELPLCDESSHTCVPCLVNGDCSNPVTPICDVPNQLCRPCDEHSDCPATACDLAVGSCFPPDATSHGYVDMAICAEGRDDPSCPESSPCCQLADAFSPELIDKQAYTVIHVAAGLYTTQVQLIVGSKKIAVLAAPGAVLRPEQNQSPALQLGDASGDIVIDSALYLKGLNVSGTLSAGGIACYHDTGSLWFDDGSIGGHAGPGLHARACRTTVRRSYIQGNFTGVHADEASEVLLRNVILSGAHSDVASRSSSSGVLDILYTTIVDHHIEPGHLFACASLTPITVRNSIAFTANGSLIDLGCPFTAKYSAFTQNTLNGPDTTNEFFTLDAQANLFNDWATDDLDLKGANNPAGALALWHTGDPRTDIHGAPRPTIDMSADAVGADIPVP